MLKIVARVPLQLLREMLLLKFSFMILLMDHGKMYMNRLWFHILREKPFLEAKQLVVWIHHISMLSSSEMVCMQQAILNLGAKLKFLRTDYLSGIMSYRTLLCHMKNLPTLHSKSFNEKAIKIWLETWLSSKIQLKNSVPGQQPLGCWPL